MIVVTVMMIWVISSQQLCRDCVLGQFRDKWHNCITGSNQDHYDDAGDDDHDVEFYDEDGTNSDSFDKVHNVLNEKVYLSEKV